MRYFPNISSQWASYLRRIGFKDSEIELFTYDDALKVIKTFEQQNKQSKKAARRTLHQFIR